MTSRPPSITPRDWERMSWHQRERALRRDKARRDFLAIVERERPAPPLPGPTLMTTEVRQSLRRTLAVFNRELEDYNRARRAAAAERRRAARTAAA